MTGFVRSLPGRDLLVVVSGRYRNILGKGTLKVLEEQYADRFLPLPETIGTKGWVHLPTGKAVRPLPGNSSALRLDEVMRQAPFAVLCREDGFKRQEMP